MCADSDSLGRVLVIIPAFNEEATIEEVVRRSLEHADVLVVDDCSTDRTPEILASLDRVLVLRHEKNTHIARALLDGMNYALEGGYDYAITMDAGLSHDPSELPLFLGADACDLVIGARDDTTCSNVPLYRRLLSKVAAFLMNAVLSSENRDGPKRLQDCTSGYRRFSRRAMELLTTAPLESRAFDFHIEALAFLSRGGASVREVPITYVFSNSSLTWGIAREAFAMWFRLWRSRP